MGFIKGLLSFFILTSCYLPGRAQKTVCTQEALADIVFLVDGSWSIGTENFQRIREFLFTLVDSFDVGLDKVQIGLVQYSNTPRNEFFLNSYKSKQQILNYISNLLYMGGGTRTGLGLDFLLKNQFKEEAGSRAKNGTPQIAVVITDGKSQDNVEPHAQELKQKGIILYAIGIKDADMEELAEIATKPHDQHIYNVSSFTALQGISQGFITVLCSTVEEEAKRQVSQVPQGCRANLADIVFLVDGSSSIGDADFLKVKRFLHTFIEGLDIGSNSIRVGVVQFSNDPHEDVPLGDYAHRDELLEKVDKLVYRRGGTETGKALSFVKEQYFTQAGAIQARENVPQIAVVITDGDSSDDMKIPAQELRREGVLIFTIGVGEVNFAELEAIANKPQQRFVISFRDYEALLKAASKMMNTVCISVEAKQRALAPKYSDVFVLVESSTQQTDNIRKFLIELATQLNVGSKVNRMAVAQFSERVTVEFLLNAYKTSNEAIELIRRFQLRSTGRSNLGQAMDYVRTRLLNAESGSRIAQGFKQYLLVISEGEYDTNVLRASRALKAEGVKLVKVDTSERVDRLFYAADDSVGGKTCPGKTFNANEGLTNVIQDVTDSIDTLEEISVTGECKSAQVADIVFIVDASDAITISNFILLRNFLYQLIQGLDVGSTSMRIGMVLYGGEPKAEFYLKTFDDKLDILQYIQILSYIGGKANTSKALKFAREKVFSKELGSRRAQGVVQIAIVISEGQSPDDVTSEASKLRRSGVRVYALGIQHNNDTQLRQIASHPPRKYLYKVDSFAKLGIIERFLRKTLCNNVVRRTVTKINQFNIKQGCAQTEEADIYFLIDHSGSIDPPDFQDMKKFILEVLLHFNIGPKLVRVGVVKFESSPTLEFKVTTYNNKASIEKAVIDIVQIGGGTETGKALDFMRPLFREARTTRPVRVREILIVITDGESTDAVKQPAAALKNDGVSVYAVGVKQANVTQLLEMASGPSKMFFVENYDALKPLKDEIVTDICSEDACKEMKADIIFLVDGSCMIGNADFSKIKKFVNNTVSRLKIGKDSVQVGLMQFSTNPRAEFQLNSYYDKREMMRAVSEIVHNEKSPLIGKALEQLPQLFDPAKGGRRNTPKFLVLITGAESWDEVNAPAKALRDKGVTIYSIGIGEAKSLQLRNISGSPKQVYMERNLDALDLLDDNLLLRICNSAEDCQKTQVADVVFLVDGSSSIIDEDFNKMKIFMSLVVNNTEVGEQYVRFCTIVYSTTPKVNFTLNRYYTKREVNSAISKLTAPKEDTHTAAALAYSVEYFGKAWGGRAEEGVPQLMFVITDGEAQDRVYLREPASKLHNLGIKVFSIGVGKAVEEELKIIASDKNKIFRVENYEALKDLHQNISRVLCNNSKPVCNKEAADLVILIDGSESIKEVSWKTMINFMMRFVDSLRVREDLFRIGVAQFSSSYRKEFYLNEHMDEAGVKKAIQGIKQMKDGTYIGRALTEVAEFFEAKAGSRINSGISQNLLLITDGASNDDIYIPTDRLKAMNINMFVFGIGEVSAEQIEYIAGANGVFVVDSFDQLKLNSTVLEIISHICNQPQTEPGCTVDIGVGFDVSRIRAGSQSLFTGQKKLENYLPEIIRSISTMYNVCCLKEPTLQTKTGFRLVARDGRTLYDTNFETYDNEVMKKVMAQQITEPLAFNSQLLKSFQTKHAASTTGVKIVIIFTDGLDDSTEALMRASQDLSRSGVKALLIVALDGVQNTIEMQKLEFGRGFGYKEPLTIGMQSVTSAIHKQIDSVISRECCNVMCKCTGQEGARGLRGPSGIKGTRGQKGHPGFPGEEGGIGERGPPGLNGTIGHQGCAGKRGLKGGRGYRGDMGEDGDHGLDGVNGEQGLTGSPGNSGERGDAGGPGQRGVRGSSGVPGEKGLRGDPGQPGSSNSIRGPKGELGNPGLPGEEGTPGEPGRQGESGKSGPKGRRGTAGVTGARGPPGDRGLEGITGAPGPMGRIGPNGAPGQKGTPGLPGPQGSPGSPGGFGSKGNIGPRGQKGQPGDPGDKGPAGPQGPRGLPGTDGPDGYGLAGPKGQKGDVGFPGNPGLQGEAGDRGPSGGNGPKGNKGRPGNSGRPGDLGNPGSMGPPGHKGPKGPKGIRDMSTCQLITYVRDNCVCCKDNVVCPAYPTELVIGLDMSDGVTPALFERMRSTLVTLLEGINIAESNCPTGARVAVVSYSSNTKYLIRFSDHRRKKDLLEAVKNIALERTSNPRDIGAAMRFVGRNVFKRVRQGVLMRKVAVFLTGGQSQNLASITTAVLEYKALDISLGVIAFRNAPNVRRAFEADETESFILFVLERPRDQAAAIERIQQCVVCYDLCTPAVGCRRASTVRKEVDLDLALLVDGSRSIQEAQYEKVKGVLNTLLNQIVVSRQPDRTDTQARVALYQQSSAYVEGQSSVRQIFNFQQFQDHSQMQQSIFQNLKQTGGSSRLGRAVEFTIMRGLLTASKPRKNKMLLVIVGEETDFTDRANLDFISKMAKCQGIVTFILTVGDHFNNTQVEELASLPMEQHIVHLGHVKQREQDYAQRFVRTFFQILNKNMNSYPPPSLRRECDNIQQGQGQGQGQLRPQGGVDLYGDVYENAEGPPIDRIPLSTPAYPEEEEEVEEVKDYTKDTTTGQVDSLTPGRGDSNAQCLLDMDSGTLCGQYVQRWYYDRAVGACTLFWYGGCSGNSNRFKTEFECIKTCITNSVVVLDKTEVPAEDVCLLKNDQGPCRAYILKWFYDTQQNECARFWYGGCQGNGNRFDSQEECEAHCVTA